VDSRQFGPREGPRRCPSPRTPAGRVRTTSDFIKAQSRTFPVQALCRVLDVAPSDYYAWLKQPLSNRAQEDARLLRLIRASFVASPGIYGAPRVFLDLREAGKTCSNHRVTRLMRENRLQALHCQRSHRSAQIWTSVGVSEESCPTVGVWSVAG